MRGRARRGGTVLLLLLMLMLLRWLLVVLLWRGRAVLAGRRSRGRLTIALRLAVRRRGRRAILTRRGSGRWLAVALRRGTVGARGRGLTVALGRILTVLLGWRIRVLRRIRAVRRRLLIALWRIRLAVAGVLAAVALTRRRVSVGHSTESRWSQSRGIC